MLPVLTIGIAIIASYTLGQTSGLVNDERRGHRRPVRHRGGDDGHARHGRLHPGDGRVRPDHRQRRRHRGDVAPAGVGARQDGPPRLGGQHHEGAHQGLRHRLGGARRLPALLRLPRRGAQPHGPDAARRPVQAGGVRGRPARRDAGVLVLVAGDDGGAQGGVVGHHRSASPVQGAPGHHAGHRGSGLRRVRGHRDRGRAQGDGAAGCARRALPDRRRRGVQALRRAGRVHGRRVGRGAADGRRRSRAS